VVSKAARTLRHLDLTSGSLIAKSTAIKCGIEDRERSCGAVDFRTIEGSRFAAGATRV
jgi:hypothetical protein